MVALSSLGGAGWQFFDANGDPLSGGKLYSYAAGTSTPATTYTSNTGLTANANPIILDSAGRVPNEIWLTNATSYKFVLASSTDVIIWTKDHIPGIFADQILNATSIDYDPPFTGAVTSNYTVADKLSQYASIKDFGAVGDGVTDDSAKFTAANNANTTLVVTEGDYAIASNITMSIPVVMEEGARLIIPSGVTVTFDNGFEAGVYQTFSVSGTGEVVFNWTKLRQGYPEWWGATTGGADCYPAIMACLKACQTTFLHPGDYWVNTTVRMIYQHRWLIGSGSTYNDDPNTVTRLIVNSNSQYGLQVGPDTQPATINSFPQENVVQDLYIVRAAAPLISSACVGLQIQWTLRARIKNVKVAEHMIGIRAFGTVYLRVDDCESVRASAGTGGGTDYWRGFWVDGGASIGAAGGNASIYVYRCSAGCNIAALQTGDSIGFYLDQKFTDAFLDWPETVNCYVGINVTGTAAVGNTYANTDLHINNAIMDQYHHAGIFISNVAESGSVAVNNPYCGPATDARASLWVSNSPAAVTILNGQLVHGGAPNVQPIIIDTSTGVQILGVMVLETGSTYPAVGLSNANNCRIQPTLKNRSVTGQAAVQLTNTCTANYIAPTVMGKASAFTIGIQVVGTSDARNEYNCSAIDSTCINGGSANKLTRNGVQITATGLTGSNLASGVMT